MKGYKMRDFIEELKATDDVVGFLMENRKETIKFGVIIVGIMTALLLFLYRGGDEVDIRDTADTLESEQRTQQEGENGAYTDTGAGDDGVAVGDGEVYVDIGGAVKNPMLAQLPAGSRIEDAIQQAGGLEANADISQINRAELLTDGQKVYIPKKGEVVGGDGMTSAGAAGTGGFGDASASATGKININTADITQLQSITGVGPVTAQKIIDYRTQSGRFSRIEDIKNVSGIGDKTYENMKDQITV